MAPPGRMVERLSLSLEHIVRKSTSNAPPLAVRNGYVALRAKMAAMIAMPSRKRTLCRPRIKATTILIAATPKT